MLYDHRVHTWTALPFIWFGCHWLAMSHSCYNPFIYCYMNARFRGGFVQVLHAIPGLRHCWCVRRLVRTQDTNGNLGGMGGTNFAMTGELIDDNFGGLIRKTRIRIRCLNKSNTINSSCHAFAFWLVDNLVLFMHFASASFAVSFDSIKCPFWCSLWSKTHID